MKPGKHNPKQQMPPPAEVEALLALYNERRYAEAESGARALLKKYPEFGFGWKLLGILLYMQGKDPLPALQKTAQLLPGDAEAHSNLGNALNDLGRFDEAVVSCRRALKLSPDFAEAHSNLGNALKGLGDLAAAVASYRRAVEFKADFAIAHSNLCNVLNTLGRHDEAVTSCRRAVELKPDFAEAYNNLGNALKGLNQLDGAVASYRKALELKPDFAVAHNNLGLALQTYGQPDAALANYCRALEIKPDYAEAYGNMLYMHAFTRDIPPEEECRLAANWEKIALNENERIAARDMSFNHPPRAGRKLKLGVVSAELGQHPVADFLQPILEHLDRVRFHVTLFPTAIRTEPRAAKIRSLADEYKSLVGLSDVQAAELIRSEHIDILIDTTGHMRDNRMGLFARRAAPVQCHYIGYHGTTGLSEMDWFITDDALLPPSCDTHFREGLWRLPRLWIAYHADATLPVSRWEPSADGTIWLGSFNNLTKVRGEALALWGRVMNAIPASRLLLKDRLAKDPAVQQRIRTELGRYGIAGERVEFADQVPDWQSHMMLYDRLDIALDTIPLNSGTTAFDALWMGVPMVALEGDWMGGRMASTILKALGKPEWIARGDDEYVAIVTALAQDVEGRSSLRAKQRALLADSSLCDAEGLTRVLEDAFGEMFDRWVEKREGAHPGPVEK
jgi:protein O-GlcNAc transferase